MPDNDEFLRRLEATTLGATITREIQEARLSERTALANELAAQHKNVEKEFPRLEAAAAKTLAAVREAEAALRAARDKHARAAGAKTMASLSYTARCQEIEHELAATASPLIAEFIEKMKDDAEATRKAIQTTPRTEIDVWAARNVVRTESNADRIRARLSAIAAAIEAATEAALLADQSGIPALLHRLEADLPHVEGK